ncbi:hypothetical protein XELAEV_18011855mg [Xenopus laevis]|uniref:Uncharacterized protein n=1 Tax=Xenopus laevis TaxID=8355 RepID=A0A974HXU3_XENLA|nr:hypothetical protein XELAEV_18011855mg [Xenopus laevis]
MRRWHGTRVFLTYCIITGYCHNIMTPFIIIFSPTVNGAVLVSASLQVQILMHFKCLLIYLSFIRQTSYQSDFHSSVRLRPPQTQCQTGPPRKPNTEGLLSKKKKC